MAVAAAEAPPDGASLPASLAAVESDAVSTVDCADADGRRRRLPLASTDSVTLSYAISLASHEDDGADLATEVASQLAAAVSSGSFASTLAAAAGPSSVLAAAVPGAVETHFVAASAAPTTSPSVAALATHSSTAAVSGGVVLYVVIGVTF